MGEIESEPHVYIAGHIGWRELKADEGIGGAHDEEPRRQVRTACLIRGDDGCLGKSKH